MGKQRGYMHGAGRLTKVALAVSAMFPLSAALAQTTENAAPSPMPALAQAAAQSTAPASATPTSTPAAGDKVETVTINGVKKGELILPTSVESSSAFGL